MPAFGASGLRFTCQQTGRCCTARHDGVGYVYLSVEDRVRLAAHLGLTVADFVAKHCQVSAGDLHLAHPEQPCGFRDGHRCGVYEARPTQCRTWPFWPENMSEATWNEAARTCPGMGQGQLHSLEEVMVQVQETRRAMARTAASLEPAGGVTRTRGGTPR